MQEKMMMDVAPAIKRLNGRVDGFIKSHPERKNCLEVETVKELIQMLEAEYEEQSQG